MCVYAPGYIFMPVMISYITHMADNVSCATCSRIYISLYLNKGCKMWYCSYKIECETYIYFLC
jgi:hypothetical protein